MAWIIACTCSAHYRSSDDLSLSTAAVAPSVCLEVATVGFLLVYIASIIYIPFFLHTYSMHEGCGFGQVPLYWDGGLFPDSKGQDRFSHENAFKLN